LVSNSDAHSPPKLAREANLFDTELSYPAIFDALKTGDLDKFLGTLEFFPEEGKYHHDGHRKCGVNWTPEITLAHDIICSGCGKPVTVGVMHRVATLADRPEGVDPKTRPPFYSLLPLPEILSEVYGVGPNSKKVQGHFMQLLSKLGPEITILRETAIPDIEQAGGARLAEAIRRMRAGEVSVTAGFDGEYGIIKLFNPDEDDPTSAQMSFFTPSEIAREPAKPAFETIAEVSESYGKERQTPLEDADQVDGDVKDQLSATNESMHPLLTDLNPAQQEAMLTLDQPLIIVAGPGTGKTRTLTYRIAYLITEQGMQPEAILAITFTNKAAGEMRERLVELLGQSVADQIMIKTFHAFGTWLLRTFGSEIDLPPIFTIASEQDRQNLLKQTPPDLSSAERNQVLDQISAAKNQLLTADDVSFAGTEFAAQYGAYETMLHQFQTLDFDDLIFRAVALLETQPDVCDQVKSRFQSISVDEYQDMNVGQYRLLRLLTDATDTNVCVIGDPDQAIYGFRGADRQYFNQFQTDFPEAKRLYLSQNYRSTQLILNASGQVIDKDLSVERLKVWSDFVDQTKLDMHHAPTEKAEAEFVVHQIEQMVGGTSYFSLDSGRVDDDSVLGRTFSDFVILYRATALSHPLVEALERSGMPYQVASQTPFYDYKEIQTCLAYLWFLFNPNSVLHLNKILNPNGNRIDHKDIQQLADYAVTQGQDLWDAFAKFDDVITVPRGTILTLGILVDFLQGLKNKSKTTSLSQLLRDIQQFVAQERHLRLDEKQTERVELLIKQAQSFDTRLGDFLEATILQREIDAYDPRADRVTLMTLHASKVLEFPVVFIVGCEENLLPYQRDGQTVDVDEERRLFYVGMTRAQQKLVLTHANTRFLFGQSMENQPSRFMYDIEQTLTQIKMMATRKKQKSKDDNNATQLKLF
ncbi:MAG: UvrD-helicase domain-containing protein, partial [Chloroflexota bacterium]